MDKSIVSPFFDSRCIFVTALRSKTHTIDNTDPTCLMY